MESEDKTIETRSIYEFLVQNELVIKQELERIYEVNKYVCTLAGQFTEERKVQLHGNSMANVDAERHDKLTKLRESYKSLNIYLNYKQGFFSCCYNYLNNPGPDLRRNALRSISILVGGVANNLNLNTLEESFRDYLENDETYSLVEQFKIDLASF